MEYFIHDNGGRPFKINIDMTKKNVSIHDSYKKGNPIITTFKKVKKIYIGDSPDDFNKIRTLGNSILIKEKNGKFVFIGKCVYEFECDKNDDIIAFTSDIFLNDVPYPYAISLKYIYLLTINVKIKISDIKIKNKDLENLSLYHLYFAKKIKGKKMKIKSLIEREI